MALTTTQVNTAFLAALARPAEGSAATWGAGSLNLDSLLNNIFIAENTEDFVESLYTEFLGRASDAEGKAFWNSLLATTSKEAVLAQFKAAILAAGQTDPSNADYQGLIATNKAFVQTLYTNLLGREADAEGLDFWANALTSGTSRGDLLAQFTAAAMASGADNDDYQAITAKLAVADAFSAKFSAFNADVTADEKKAALDALKAMMEGVVAGSTVEDVQEEINQIAGNYQNRTSQVFTKANDDDLDASESTAATTFRGTVNLVDSTKGTIQTTDKVSGNTDFDDTLVVNVTSDSTHKLLDLNGDLPTVSDIEKLIVNNGSANVEGDLNDANFGKSVSITGTGDVNLKVNSSLENLSVSSATKGDVAIAVNNTLGNYTGGNAGESVTVDLGGSIKKASLGAGDDTLVINGTVTAGGAIDLGAGNDELVINSDIRVAANEDKITLDGGAGSKDTLVLNTADIYDVKSIKGFETIDAKYWTESGVNIGVKISAEAANGLKAKLTDGSGLSVNANIAETTTINLSGLSVDKGNTAIVALHNLTKETVTLSKTVAETIDISNAAAKNITIKGFVKDSDKLVIAQGAEKSVITDAKATKGLDLSKAGQVLDLLNKQTLNAGTNYVAINTSNGKASYVWKVTKVEGVDLTRDDITLVANVDKALALTDFNNGGGTPAPTPVPVTDIKAVDGNLDLSTATLSDTTKTYSIDLNTNADFAAGKVTSLSLAGVKAAGLVIENKGTTPAKAVEVSVPDNAEIITTLTLGSATDNTQYNVTVAANAKINEIVTNNVDNKIDISALPAGTVKVVNAGAGIDTLTIGGEAAADGFTMTGVEKLAYTGTTINSDAIFANAESNKTLELINESGNANKKLIVKAGTANDGNVDLSSLVNTEVTGKAAAIEVTGVASGKTVTLSSGTAAKTITETVTLGKVTNVTIANAAKGDNISSDNFAATVVGETGKFADFNNGTIVGTKAYFVNPAAATTVTDFATAKATFSEKLAAFTSGDAIIAVNGANEKVYVFAIKGATGGATATEVAIVNGKFDNSYGIQNGTITIADTAPEPQPTSGELQAALIEGLTTDYELTVVNPPVSVDEAGTVLKLASDKVTTLKAAGAVSLTVNATSEKAATLSFDAAVKNSDKIELVDLQGTGTRTVDLANVNATAVKNIKDGAANTTLDISGKTFASSGASGDQFLNGLKIDLGEGTDVVVLGGTIASGAFTLTGVEGIKASGGTLDADLVTKVASGAVTTDLTQIEGSLTLKNFAAATTSIDLSNIKTAVTNETALTIDIVADTAVSGGTLASVIGTAATDTLVVSGDYTKLTTLDSIETLSLSGDTTLKAAAITGDTLVISSSGSNKLTVDASGADTLDLANLSKGAAGTPTIDITNVGSGATITLGATTGATEIAETVKLAATATSVTINNVHVGDTINVKGISAFSDKKGSATSFTNATTDSKVTLDDTNNVYIDLSATKTLVEIKNTDLTAYITNSSGKKALIAVEGSDGIKFFSALGGASSATFAELDVTLLGVAGANVTNATLSLA